MIKNDKVFIVAELSANHNGSIDTAIKTIVAAAKSGADAQWHLRPRAPESYVLPTAMRQMSRREGCITHSRMLP